MSQSSAKSRTSRPPPQAEYLEPRKEDESNYIYGWTDAKIIIDGKYGDIFDLRRNDRGGGDAKKGCKYNSVAVKTLKLDKENEIPPHVQREIKALKILRDNPQNDRLIELLDWFLSNNEKLNGWHFCLVFPYLPYDLHDFVVNIEEGKEAPWSEKRIKNLARQTLEGIEFLHGLRLVHRDIKAENILVKSNRQGGDRFKITDFGFTELLPADVKTIDVQHWAGTPECCSPEQLKHILGYCCDIWSFGVTLLELCNKGIPPWKMKDYKLPSDLEMDDEEKKEKLNEEKKKAQKKVADEIINNEPHWNSEMWKDIPEGGTHRGVRPYSTAAKDFIVKLLEKDHEKRLTATEALKLDWLTAHDDAPRERPHPTSVESEHYGKKERAVPAAGTTEKRDEHRRPTDVGSVPNGRTKRTASTASITEQLKEQMIGCSISSTNSLSSHDKRKPKQTQHKKPEQKAERDEKSEKATKPQRQPLATQNNAHNRGPNQPPNRGKHRGRK